MEKWERALKRQLLRVHTLWGQIFRFSTKEKQEKFCPLPVIHISPFFGGIVDTPPSFVPGVDIGVDVLDDLGHLGGFLGHGLHLLDGVHDRGVVPSLEGLADLLQG